MKAQKRATQPGQKKQERLLGYINQTLRRRIILSTEDIMNKDRSK